ncbi:MAG: hypothetical protein ACYTFV_10950, partial [Planctomycetota bacterium]
MNENMPRALRWTIRLLTAVILLLFVWLEGFVIADIDSLPGPDRSALVESGVDPELTTRSGQLEGANRTEARQSADATLRQFTEQQRFELEQDRVPSKVLEEALDAARTSFLAASESFEEANAQVATLQSEMSGLRSELRTVRERIAGQRALGEKQ